MSSLPERLILSEDGEWQAPYSISTINVDHDKEEWISAGWQARTYDGIVWYGGHGRSKQEVLDWLARKGYVDTGGVYFELSAEAMLDASIEPGIRKGVYSIFSTWTKEANSYTALGLVEIAQFVAEHPEIQQEAQARREELAKEEK